MGVDYTAVLAVGKEFTSVTKAERFMREHGLLTEFTEDEVEDMGLAECVDGSGRSLKFQSLDLYSGGYYYLGFTLDPRSVDSFRKDFEEAVEKWDKLFPDSPPDMIHTVRYS